MTVQSEASGRCLCGAVELRLSGEPLSVTYCHCATCRRATGGPVAVFVGYALPQIAFTKHKPRAFPSSPGVDRPFCPDCGTRIGYSDAELPGRLYLHIGVLDRPEDFVPQWHAFDSHRLPWLRIDDGLERFDGFSVKRQEKSLETCG